MGAVGVGIGHEIRIAEGHSEIGELVDRLLPADHAIGGILDHKHDEIELQSHGGLELLAVHHEAAIAADREHALVRIEAFGRDRRREPRAHRRQRIVEQQRVGD